MSDLHSLAIAAIAESGSKSPRMTAFLLKLAACSCPEANSGEGFFGSLQGTDALSAVPQFLFAGSAGNDVPGSTPNHFSGILISGPGPIGSPAGAAVNHFTVRHTGTRTSPNDSLVTYRLYRNNVAIAGATIILSTHIALGLKQDSVTFPGVSPNVGDIFSVGATGTAAATDMVEILASYG